MKAYHKCTLDAVNSLISLEKDNVREICLLFVCRLTVVFLGLNLVPGAVLIHFQDAKVFCVAGASTACEL